MTVSPPSSDSPHPPQADSSTVSPDSVGWLFIQKYYEVYTKNISNLYKLYDKNASINHDKFLGTTPQKVMYQAKGTEAIKTLFKNAETDEKSQGKNRIVITSADFQTSLEKNILIVVFGEWSKGDSPYWQFSQTFLLAPSKEKVYDVANDILKFTEVGKYSPDHVNTIISNEKNDDASVPPQSIEVSAKPTESKTASSTSTTAPTSTSAAPTTGPNGQAKQSDSKLEATSTSDPTDLVSEPVVTNADKQAHSSNSSQADSTTEPKSKPQEEPEQEQTSNHISADPETTPEPSKSNVPLSWADLAAKEPPKSTSGKVATVASPGAAKVAPAPLPIAKKSTPPQNRTSPVPSPATTTATTASGKTVSGGKYKKEEWYPIYVKNLEVKDDELKSALVSNFGDIKFYKRNDKVALIDFQTREGQESALKAKTLQISDNVISLQPRESKNANGKADFKRGRNEKKQNVKKNNRSSSRS